MRIEPCHCVGIFYIRCMTKHRYGLVAGKKKRISEAEYQRRSRISKALKKHHQEKKRDALKKFSVRDTVRKPSKSKSKRVSKTDRRSGRSKLGTPSPSFVVGRERTRVKAYPRKDKKSVFFFADKRRYKLREPIDITTPKDIKRALKKVGEFKSTFKKDFSKKKIKNRTVNIGYKLKLQFEGANGTTVIESTSYLKSFLANSENDVDRSVEAMKESIEERFNEYLARKAFAGFELYGFETEISSEGIF